MDGNGRKQVHSSIKIWDYGAVCSSLLTFNAYVIRSLRLHSHSNDANVAHLYLMSLWAPVNTRMCDSTQSEHPELLYLIDVYTCICCVQWASCWLLATNRLFELSNVVNGEIGEIVSFFPNFHYNVQLQWPNISELFSILMLLEWP